MKGIKIDLKIVVKGIKAINSRLDKMISAIESASAKSAVKKKSTAKKAAKKPVKKTAKKGVDQQTAFDSVVKMIIRSKKGIKAADIKKKTGYDDKKIANIIYKAKKRGLIKNVSKGLYTKA